MTAGQPQLLLVLNDDKRAEVYRMLAEAEGWSVDKAEGGLHAMTQLERSNADFVISDLQLEDLSGDELWNIVRNDPKGKDLPFVLIGDQRPVGFAQKHDILLSSARSGRQVLARLLRHLNLKSSPQPLHLHGELGDIGLLDAITLFNELGKSGEFLIEVEGNQAYLLFVKGDLVFAEYAGLKGQPAVLKVMEDIHEQLDIAFSFTEKEIPGREEQYRNIVLPTPKLLMELTVLFDEARA